MAPEGVNYLSHMYERGRNESNISVVLAHNELFTLGAQNKVQGREVFQGAGMKPACTSHPCTLGSGSAYMQFLSPW